MFLKVARSIARPQAVAILDLVKRSTGLSVNELAKVLKLSYMGAKQYCNELEKKGMLDTFRRPKSIGRPDMLYRLTPKAEAFYPEVGNELSIDLLESARQLYGPSAPDKLLFNYFSKKADAYLKKLKGATLLERATSLAKLRDAEGYCSQIERDSTRGLQLIEFHSLLKEISISFPNVSRLEELMLSRVLGIRLQRQETRLSGLTKIVFQSESTDLSQPAPEPVLPVEPDNAIESVIEIEPEMEPASPLETTVVAEAPQAAFIEDPEEEASPVWNMLAPPTASQPAPPSASVATTPLSTPSQKTEEPTPFTTPTQGFFEDFRLVG